MKNYLPPELLAHDSKRENNATFMGIAKEKRGKILDTLINNLPDIVLIKKQALLNRHLQSKQAAESDDSFHKILYSLGMHTITFRWLADKKKIRIIKNSISFLS